MTQLSRLLLILSIFILHNNLYAQLDTSSYQIEWKKPATLILDGKYTKIISFEQASHRRENQYLPSLLVSVKGFYSTEYNLFNVEWVPLTETESANLPANCKISSDITSSIYNTAENNTNVAQIEVVPLRRNSAGQIEKVVKFQIKVFPITSPFFNDKGARSQNRISASGSVLSLGDWFKIPITSSGIYKIDFKYLKSLGIDPNQINPRNIQIWGNSGGVLPEPCSIPRPKDLNQIPIFISDGNDGKFDEMDYVLLYLEGADVWQYNKNQPYFTYSHNIYSASAYCFLTISTSQGKKIELENIVQQSPDVVLSSFSNRYHHEVDFYNFLSSGRKWYGEEFDNNLNQSFAIPANGVVPGSSVHVTSSFMNRSPQPEINTFDLSINSKSFISHNIPGGGSGVYDRIGNDEIYNDSISSDKFAGSQTLLFNINYTKNSGVGKGYLDFFSLTFEDNLVLNSNYLSFRNFKSRVNGVVQYNINLNTLSQVRVWDITDINNIYEPSVETSGEIASFKFSSGNDTTLREFIAFSGISFPSPGAGEKISNQNIHASSTPDFLIITHPLFKNQANKLADFRREHDKMDVVVVTTDEVYNEFSTGKSDLVAIRDCAKMFNDKTDSKLKYLLLLGDCSYDYKNLKGLSNPQNFVPIYESDESLMPTESYSSDDYVGLLSNQEGAWLNYNYDLMEIGVGRLPVRTPEEAEAIVQKIIHYSSSPLTLGQWRQNLTFIADNEEGNEFLDNAESLSISSTFLQNNFNTKKIYLAAYAHDQGFTPQANLDIAQQFENGTLIMNYIGHGGEKQLASENVINIGTIAALSNFDKMPFMVTATCDFGKYDDPTISSGGELFIFNPQGGAIGILCTTRPVFQNYNKRINKAFHDYVFTKNANGSNLKLGELIRLSKNNSLSGVFNRNFALLGDPSLTLAYPENYIEITKINEKAFVPFADTLKAQSKVSISGKITRKGVIHTDFNGVINALIFDKSTNVNTIESPKYAFDVRDSKIFDGSATVKNGEFSFTFIVPKNINYIVGNGKVLLYANFEDGRLNDAGGGDSQILVGGGDKNAPNENIPPKIKVYLNDESFVSGGITNESPLLIVKLYDESGISSIGDMGKSISAIINNNTKNEKKLDNYYKSDRDTYKSGTIKYKLASSDGINEGFNSIKIKAFDTFENGVENGGTIEFNVANHQNLTIKNLLNYPNPFTSSTVFHFDHNRAGDDLDILLQVYTVTGKLVKSLNSHTVSAHTHISDLVWDGKDDYGDNIGRGVYVYKLSVKALSDGFRKDEYQKLVILN